MRRMRRRFFNVLASEPAQFLMYVYFIYLAIREGGNYWGFLGGVFLTIVILEIGEASKPLLVKAIEWHLDRKERRDD